MTENELVIAQLIAFGLVLTRCSGFLIASPVWGDTSVPALVKIGLSISLSFVFFTRYGTTALSSDAVTWQYLAVQIPLEFCLGSLLGMAMSLLFVPLRIAGSFITQEIGLTLGSLAGPGLTDPPPGLGMLLYTAGVMCFLGADLHHGLITALTITFERLPAGAMPFAAWAPWYARELTYAHDIGFVVVGGMVVALSATTLFLLFLTKASPIFNLFTIGTSIRLAAGLLSFLLFLPDIVWAVTSSLSGSLDRMLTWLAS